MDTLTLDYIKTATAVATFLVSGRLEATVTNIRDYFRSRPSPLAATFEQPKEVAFVAKLVINPDLLDDLTQDVQGSITDYRDCLNASTRPQERDACDRRAERRVCETLNRIRDRNDDELPTDYLNDQWTSYRCVVIPP